MILGATVPGLAIPRLAIPGPVISGLAIAGPVVSGPALLLRTALSDPAGEFRRNMLRPAVFPGLDIVSLKRE